VSMGARGDSVMGVWVKIDGCEKYVLPSWRCSLVLSYVYVPGRSDQ
jgi:hypothetical protein